MPVLLLPDRDLRRLARIGRAAGSSTSPGARRCGRSTSPRCAGSRRSAGRGRGGGSTTGRCSSSACCCWRWSQLWLARPALTGPRAATPWLAVVPGVAGPSPGGGERHWLAPGFPPLDRAAPAGPLPVASLLRQLDAELPPDAPLTVVVPATLEGADAERPRLSRRVTWRVVAGAMPAAPPVPRGGRSPADGPLRRRSGGRGPVSARRGGRVAAAGPAAGRRRRPRDGGAPRRARRPHLARRPAVAGGGRLGAPRRDGAGRGRRGRRRTPPSSGATRSARRSSRRRRSAGDASCASPGDSTPPTCRRCSSPTSRRGSAPCSPRRPPRRRASRRPITRR